MQEAAAPIINNLNAPFWRAAARHVLALPHCVITDRAFWPPSPVSPFAGGGAVEWREVEPVGRLIAKVTYHRGFQAAFKDLMPYGVGLVELPSGPRLQVHIQNPKEKDTAQVGDQIRIFFRALVPGDHLIPVGVAIG